MKSKWLFPIISWVFAFAFLAFFFLDWGLPPDIPPNTPDWIYLAIGLLFTLLPFFTYIKIGDLIELKREIGEAKQELNEQSQYTNAMFARLNANVTAVSSSIQNVHVHLGQTQDKTQPPPIPEEDLKRPQTSAKYRSDRVAFSLVSEDDDEDDIDPKNLDWSNLSEELFWLGQGLMYIKAVLLSGGPVNQIRFALRQSYLHMKNLQLDKSKSMLIILAIFTKIQSTSENPPDPITREEMARGVQSAIYRIGNLCKRYQKYHSSEDATD